MNPLIKAALKVAEQVAVAAVPGAAVVDAAVRAAVAKEKNVVDLAPDLAFGAIQVIESIKGTDIADEAKFKQGVALLHAGFDLVKDSLKHDPKVAASDKK